MELLTFLGKISPGRMVLIIFLSAVVGMTGGLIIPLAIHTVTVLTSGRPTVFNVTLLPGVVILFILAKRFSHLQTAALTEQALEDVILRIADAVRRLDFPTFEQLDRAEIYARLVNTPEITTAVIKSIDVLQNLLIMFTCWLYLFLRSLSAGAVFISACFLIFLALQLFDKLSVPLVHEEADTERRLFQVVNHLLYGFKELKLDHRKNTELFEHYLLPLLDGIKTLHCRILLYVSERGLLMAICIFLVAGCTVFFFAPYDRSGEFLETLIIILYITTPANIIYDAIPYLSTGKEALQRLAKLLEQFDMAEQERPATGLHIAQSPHMAVQEVQLENVLFTYPSQADETGFTVGPLSLSFKGGEITFIAGGNGSGKTTLLYLLTGLYQPLSGMIRLNGQPINMANHQDLLAPVFADVHLFDQLYGLEHVEERRITEVLAQLELTHALQVHERRFSTLKLSAGQQKRLALAVAIWEDKPVYVFDEWAANQDPHFRRYFYEELLPSFKAQGKTIIAITHDDAYYHVADHLIKLDYGLVVHEEFSPQPPQALPPQPASLSHAPAAETAARPRPADAAPAGNLSGEVSGFEVSETLIRQLQRFFADIPPHLWRVALWLLSLANVCEVSIVFFLYQVRDTIFSARGQWLFTMFMLTLVMYITVYRRFDRLVSAFIEDRIAHLRRRFAEQVRRLNLLTFQELSVESIYTMLTYDIKAVAATSYSVIVVCYAVFTTVITLFYLTLLSPMAVLLVIAVLGGIGTLYVRSLFRLRRLIDDLRAHEQQLFATINHLLDGFKELRLNGPKNEDFFRNGVQAQVAQLRQVKTRTNRFFIHNQTLAYVLWEALVVLIVIGLPLLASFSTSTEDLLRIVGLVLFLPFSPLLETVPQLTIASLSVGRVLTMGALIESSVPEPVAPSAEPEPLAFQELSYQHLTFAYRAAGQRSFKVGPIDLTLTPGEIVFLTGGNGSGKSTLVKALMGLYPVQSGTVSLNQHVIPIMATRQAFGAVFSDYHLFDRLYGLPDVAPDQVQEWLRIMELDQKVQFVDNQFSTLELSTGQRKRLALLTALLENKPIYVFDEWAADQDPHFRAYFYQTLLPTLKAQAKTVLAVTHDEHYFHIADRILKMDDGKLVAEETRDGSCGH